MGELRKNFKILVLKPTGRSWVVFEAKLTVVYLHPKKEFGSSNQI